MGIRRNFKSNSKSAIDDVVERTPFFENQIWMNSREAAAYLRISVNSLRIRVLRRQVSAHKYCGRLMFKRSDLDRHIRPLK